MPQNYGIPAFIPVQTDSLVTETVDGEHVDMCLTDTYKVVGYTNAAGEVVLVTYLRSNGYKVDTTIFDDLGAIKHFRTVASGNKPMAIWLRADDTLEYTVWTGNGWDDKAEITDICVWFDVVAVPNGCHVAWIEDDEVDTVIKVGNFKDGATSSAHYDFPTVVDEDDNDARLAVAIDASPGGELVVAWRSLLNTHTVTVLSSAAVQIVDNPFVFIDDADATSTFGLTVVYRGLRDSQGHWPFVVYLAGSDEQVRIYEVEAAGSEKVGFGLFLRRAETLPNCRLESRAFRIGDEVFAWLRGTSSDTHFCIAGVTDALRIAIADREESVERYPHDGSQTGLCNMAADPLVEDGSQLSWARKYNIGPWPRPGNAREGAMNFLPHLSTTKFGKSVYIAGSLVRNWDGQVLGDAGFHDYPAITAAVMTNGAGSIANGEYLVRIYVTRYNQQGEKFQSVTVLSAPITVAGSDDTITLSVSPVVITNHDDCKLEVYRTKDGGDTFYLEKTVDNDRSLATFDIELGLVDAELELGRIDPIGPDVGEEIEEFGPTGCELITTAGDRLWCTGGQVAAGTAIFSKLIEPGEGAGFDALGGYVIADCTGGRITSITGFGDTTVTVFQDKQVYQIYGTGPGNLVGDEGFAAPRLTIVDGATTHWGTIVLPVGIAYWGANGPRLMTLDGRVEAISESMVPLTSTLTPTGVRWDQARREVVWYTATGDAVLWNYAEVARTFDSGVVAAGSRWARWDNLPIAGVSPRLLVTTDGRVLTQASTPKDDGRRFEFKFGSGLIRPEELLQDYTKMRRLGIVGQHNGPHRVRIEVYYDGSPLWSERFRWEPETNTWLSEGTEFEDLTPAEIDALNFTDQGGGYSTHHRVERQRCKFFRVVVSDCGDAGFTPWELSFELGQGPGMGRTVVNTFAK